MAQLTQLANRARVPDLTSDATVGSPEPVAGVPENVPLECELMMRLVWVVGCVALLATPALATNEFAKEWRGHYVTDESSREFTTATRRAGCNVCHIKGEKKTERNEYGKAVSEFLSKDKFTKDWVKDNPEEAKKLIVAGLKKAGEKKSSDGKVFADKLSAEELPATDANL